MDTYATWVKGKGYGNIYRLRRHIILLYNGELICIPADCDFEVFTDCGARMQ